MRKPHQSPVERAFELARTGAFEQKAQIAVHMVREGWGGHELAQLWGPSMSRQLREACRSAIGPASRSV